MSVPITVVSSKATAALLAELVAVFQAGSGRPVTLESVGGVDAKRRVLAGERFDVVVLSSDAVDELLASGSVLGGSKVDLVRSGVAIAVRRGTPHPDVGSESALRRAVLAAQTIGHSTGPSGVALGKLFEQWSIAEEIRDRIVVAPPGVSVGSLIARGEVELGFQQLSELLHVEGVDVLGSLPEPISITTTFSAAIGAASSQPDAARSLLSFLSSNDAIDAKRRQGMEAA